VRLSRRQLRVIEVIVGLVAVLAAYDTASLCVSSAIHRAGLAIWFAVLEGGLSVGLWVAAYGLLFRGTDWRPWRRYRLR
jgi:hypothetical protein